MKLAFFGLILAVNCYFKNKPIFAAPEPFAARQAKPPAGYVAGPFFILTKIRGQNRAQSTGIIVATRYSWI